MARRFDDWDELTHAHQRSESGLNVKKHKSLTQNQIDDLDYEFHEETAFIKNLENSSESMTG